MIISSPRTVHYIQKIHCLTRELRVEFHAKNRDITCPRVDMNFIFEWSTRYLTRSLRSLVRYRVEHESIKFISISEYVISSNYYIIIKITISSIVIGLKKLLFSSSSLAKLLSDSLLSDSSTNQSNSFL